MNKYERIVTAARIFADAFPWELSHVEGREGHAKCEAVAAKAFIVLLGVGSKKAHARVNKLNRRIKE